MGMLEFAEGIADIAAALPSISLHEGLSGLKKGESDDVYPFNAWTMESDMMKADLEKKRLLHGYLDDAILNEG